MMVMLCVFRYLYSDVLSICGLGIIVVGSVECLIVIMMLFVWCSCLSCVIVVLGVRLRCVSLLWFVVCSVCDSYIELGMKLCWCIFVVKLMRCDSGLVMCGVMKLFVLCVCLIRFCLISSVRV